MQPKLIRSQAPVFLRLGWLLFLLCIASPAQAAQPLQPLIDATPAGATLALPPGEYEGPATIHRPLVLDGGGKAIVSNAGKGTVLTVTASGVTVTRLEIRGSGISHDTEDAGIHIHGTHNRIVGNRIHDCLFGVELKESNENEVLDNDITSKPFDLGLRGDGIVLFASNKNRIAGNRVHDSRDFVVWYSKDNLIEYNAGWNNRYSLHFMYADDNTVRLNEFRHSSVGIILMYSNRNRIAGNRIFSSIGATGVGVGFFESDNNAMQANEIVYCATGVFVDNSPVSDDATNRFDQNVIAYNIVGVSFHSELEGNEFRGNRFEENLAMVTVDANGTALKSLWDGNYWGDYEGFDRNRDGVGDSPYENRLYIGQLWSSYPATRFFYGSPIMSTLEFLAKLAPFAEPKLLVRDRRPIFHREQLVAGVPAYQSQSSAVPSAQ